VLAILDVGYRADFLDGVVGDNEAATFEGKFALGLRDDLIESGFADDDGVHRLSAEVGSFACTAQGSIGKLSRSAVAPQRRSRAPGADGTGWLARGAPAL
jgi:hypothetical protein